MVTLSKTIEDHRVLWKATLQKESIRVLFQNPGPGYLQNSSNKCQMTKSVFAIFSVWKMPGNRSERPGAQHFEQRSSSPVKGLYHAPEPSEPYRSFPVPDHNRVEFRAKPAEAFRDNRVNSLQDFSVELYPKSHRPRTSTSSISLASNDLHVSDPNLTDSQRIQTLQTFEDPHQYAKVTRPSSPVKTFVTRPSSPVKTFGGTLYPSSSSKLQNVNDTGDLLSSAKSPGLRPQARVLSSPVPPRRSHSLHRASSFNGPYDSKHNSPKNSVILHYDKLVSAKSAKDHLQSPGNDRQNGRVSLSHEFMKDPNLTSNGSKAGHSFITASNLQLGQGLYRNGSEVEDTASKSDLNAGPHFTNHEDLSYGVARPRLSSTFGTSDSPTSKLQQKIDEINLRHQTSSPYLNSSNKNRLPETFKPPADPFSYGTRVRENSKDWDVSWGREDSLPVYSTSPIVPEHEFSSLTMEHRFHSAPTRKLKSILKKKSAYDTVSGGETWGSYFQEAEFNGYGLNRQNTMPIMRHSSSRPPLPQLGRRPSGKRVHFAMWRRLWTSFCWDTEETLLSNESTCSVIVRVHMYK